MTRVEIDYQINNIVARYGVKEGFYDSSNRDALRNFIRKCVAFALRKRCELTWVTIGQILHVDHSSALYMYKAMIKKFYDLTIDEREILEDVLRSFELEIDPAITNAADHAEELTRKLHEVESGLLTIEKEYKRINTVMRELQRGIYEIRTYVRKSNTAT